MRELTINSSKSDDIFSQIQTCIQGELIEDWGESVLTFDNTVGKGSLRTIDLTGEYLLLIVI